MKNRVGILGGSFDPIHIGHLLLAEYAKQELNLDRLVFVPCHESVYSDKVIEASQGDRLSMLLADTYTSDNNAIGDCNEKLNYTIDMVKYYIEYFKYGEIILIAGTDTVDKFDSWKDSEEIKKLVDVKFAGKDFYVPEIGINSTLIRKLVKEGNPITNLVSKEVEDYIIENNLYK